MKILFVIALGVFSNITEAQEQSNGWSLSNIERSGLLTGFIGLAGVRYRPQTHENGNWHGFMQAKGGYDLGDTITSR